jgi:hypothetical protein
MDGNGHGSLSERIRLAEDLTRELVELPEWGVTIQVRALPVGERLRLAREWRVENEEDGINENFYPTLLVASVYDPETGDPVFGEDALEWLNEKSSGPVERLAQVAVRLSGLGPTGVDDAGEGS